jgi:hypothetical protein
MARVRHPRGMKWRHSRMWVVNNAVFRSGTAPVPVEGSPSSCALLIAPWKDWATGRCGSTTPDGGGCSTDCAGSDHWADIVSLRSPSSSWSCSASGRIATLRSRRRGGVLCDAPGRTPEPNRPKSEARTWLAETFGSLSPSRARSASAGTIRRIRASGTIRSASSSGSTAAGAGAIGRTARRAELVGAPRGP